MYILGDLNNQRSIANDVGVIVMIKFRPNYGAFRSMDYDYVW